MPGHAALSAGCWSCRWASMLPPSVQVCPVELPGRGRRSEEPAISDVVTLADQLAQALPLQASLPAQCLHA